MNSVKILGTGLLSLLLAACSNFGAKEPAPIQPSASWDEHQKALYLIQEWNIDGKIGLRTAKSSNSARLKWHQTPQKYQIDIRGPLGQGGASMQGTPSHVVVEIPGEGRFEGTSPEAILKRELNWDLPLSDIFWWIRGLPSPFQPYDHSLEDNRLKQLQQAGWSIDYLRYNNSVPALPRKLRLTHSDLQITLVINSWIVP